MMKQSELLEKKMLKEADLKVSQQIVNKAIKEGKTILISSNKEGNTTSTSSNIIMNPTEIKDDLVFGTTVKDNEPFQANLTDVVSIMDEELSTDKVAIDSDSNHGIVEEEEDNLNDERDGIISNNVYESPEELEDNDSPVDLAIFNLKSWVTELGLNLSNESKEGNLVSFILNSKGGEEVFKTSPTVYIYSNGKITLSGHKVESFKDLELIINFLKESNS